MNHAGEIDAAVAPGPPARRGHHHGRGRRISSFFASVEAIADAKARDLRRHERPAMRRAQPRQSPFRAPGRTAPAARHRPHPRLRPQSRRRRPPDRLPELQATAATVTAEILGRRIDYRLRRARRALGAEQPRGAGRRRSPRAAMSTRRRRAAPSASARSPGRGQRRQMRRYRRRHARADRRKLQRQPGLDARRLRGAGARRAGPAAAASPCSATCASSATERSGLHADAGARHRRRRRRSRASPAARRCTPCTRRCRRRGAARTRRTSPDRPLVLGDAAAAHACWSRARSAPTWRRSSRPAEPWTSWRAALPATPARRTAAERVAPMLYNLLAPWPTSIQPLQPLPLPHLPHGGAVVTALLISFIIGPPHHPLAASASSARASRSAATGRSPPHRPRRARRPWAAC